MFNLIKRERPVVIIFRDRIQISNLYKIRFLKTEQMSPKIKTENKQIILHLIDNEEVAESTVTCC